MFFRMLRWLLTGILLSTILGAIWIDFSIPIRPLQTDWSTMAMREFFGSRLNLHITIDAPVKILRNSRLECDPEAPYRLDSMEVLFLSLRNMLAKNYTAEFWPVPPENGVLVAGSVNDVTINKTQVDLGLPKSAFVAAEFTLTDVSCNAWVRICHNFPEPECAESAIAGLHKQLLSNAQSYFPVKWGNKYYGGVIVRFLKVDCWMLQNPYMGEFLWEFI